MRRQQTYTCDIGAEKEYDLLIQFESKVTEAAFIENQRVVVQEHSLAWYIIFPPVPCQKRGYLVTPHLLVVQKSVMKHHILNIEPGTS